MSKHVRLNLLVLMHLNSFIVDLKQGWEKGEIWTHDPSGPKG